MEKLPVSIVVITKNEERNIADCLKSAAWADELIVVDDYSTDNTVNIARQFTDKIFSKKMEIEGAHRNYAYSLARNRWVLSLDADEMVSKELSEELREIFNPSAGSGLTLSPSTSSGRMPSLSRQSKVEGVKESLKDDAYTIPIRTYIGKRWIRHGGWYPAGKVRLFKKERFRYDEVEVHPRVFIDGSYGYLTNDIIHHSYRDFHDFFQSLNSQTTLEARKWFNERRKIGFVKACRKFIDRFLKSYILKQGFRDGLLGFVVAYGSGLYQLMSYVKYQEMLEEERLKR